MMASFISFMIGGLIGVITMALAVAAGDADRCENCLMRDKDWIPRSYYENVIQALTEKHAKEIEEWEREHE